MIFCHRKIKYLVKIILIGLLLISLPDNGYSQSGNCDPATPFFSVDLTGFPNGTWTSPAVPRVGNCCGTLPPDKCIEISITLDPAAVAINFQIVSGAVPPGALYYQIGCGPQIPVGSPICLSGPGPYTLTFCKPGNNINQYAITSIAGPTVSPDDTIGDGCNTTIYASGLLVNSSITWNSVYPGPTGAYNSYLSCTTYCDSTLVTSQAGAPPYVDYVVCGMPTAGACVAPGLFCDTIRVYFSPPILNPVTPNPAVFCANTGGILLTGTVAGGVPPYTYAWTNGANGTGTVVGTGLTYTATASGTYSFIVYDANYPECPVPITNVPVTISPAPIINAGPDQLICGNSVILNGTVSGATGGIWTGGSGTYSPSDTVGNATYTPTSAELSSGIVILTYTSTGNGACTAVSDQVVINISPPIVVTITAPSILCYGATATLTASNTGGIAPFSYLWSNGQTTQTLTNMPAGTYSVVVTGTGGSGCNGTATVTIAGNPEIVVTTSPNNTISCSTTAIISATASGGTGTLTYLWSNGATTSSTIVNTGTYTVTVTDAVGCSASNSVSVIASNSTLTAVVNQPPVLCNNATSTLTVTANGGFGSYSYSWNTGATTSSIVVGAGNYCATVTDGGGCTISACVTVTENPLLVVNVPTPAMVCNGTTATANASVSGGQAPYSYSWSNGQTTQSITALAGNYTLTVTDAIGCNTSASVTISQATPLNVVATSTPVLCFGGNNGSATANVSGGVSGYIYSWSPYGGSSATASNLMTGTYTVTVTDAIGCTGSIPVIVTQPAPLNGTVTLNNNVGCFAGNNGSATVNPTGGTPNYSYSWSPIGGSGQSANNLITGNYIISITDVNGCTQNVSTTITQPTQLMGSMASSTNVSCFGGNNGSATVSASGGTPGYTYSWLPSGGTNATAVNLAAGSYTVTITDLNGCITQVTTNITEPTPLQSTINGSTNVSCNGGNNGSATVTASGGTGPYTYSWNTNPVQTTSTASNLPVGNYSVTITDSKGCTTTSTAIAITEPTVLIVTASPSSTIFCNNTLSISSSASGGTGMYNYLWSTGATTSSITVGTGTYTIVVTDGNGCNAIDSVSVTASNSTLLASIPTPAAICFGATTTVIVNASGGFGSYTYQWSTGATSSSIIVGAGNYCVTVTDGGGCMTNACVNVTQNTPIGVSIGTPPLICPGANATVTAVGSGGQPPYSYLWNSGQTTSSITVPAGNYSVTISDVTGSSCSATASVNVSEASPIIVSSSTFNVSCFGGNNGGVQTNVTGGMPGYTYSWAPSGGTNSSAVNLIPGTYTVTVTDQIGCTGTASGSITQPSSAVSIITSSTDVLCYGQTNGTATANGNGGTPPYFYYWTNNGASTSVITGLAPGVYEVIVADSTGCFENATVSVSEPADIVLSGSTINSTCGFNNGSATVTASGGVGGFTYSWSPSGGTAATAPNLLAGNYTVTVTDANNCIKQLALTVSPTISNLNANFSATAVCLNATTAFTDLSTVSSDSIVGWSWNFGEPASGSNTSTLKNPVHNYATSGSFTVTLTVTTQMGCTHSYSAAITVYALPVANFSFTQICVNTLATFTDISSVVGSGIIGWTWNFGDPGSGSADTAYVQHPTHIYGATGTYLVTLTVVSDNGCSRTISQNVSVTTLPTASFSATTVCPGALTEFFDSSVPSGGTLTGWSWNFGDGSAINTSQNPTHTYASGGTYNVILTVAASNGCQNSDTIPVIVYPAPVPNFSAPGACLGSPSIFTNLSTVASGSISSSTWNFGNFSPVYNGTNPNYIYSAPGTFNVTLTVTTAPGGCTASTTLPVNVYSLPNANFTSNNACLNSPTQFQDASTVSGGVIGSWIWAFGNGSPIDTLQNPSYTYLNSGTYNVSLVVTSTNGCSDTVTKPTTVLPIPIAQFFVEEAEGCATYCTDFTDLSVPQSGTITAWSWDFGDGSPNGTVQNPNHCYPLSGFYTISLTATTSNGCSATQTQTNLIHVYPLPTAEFSFTPPQATTSNSEINFTDLSSGATSWSWDFDDIYNPTAASFLESPSYVYPEQGNYCPTLLVQNDYLCIDTVTHCLKIDPEFTFYIPNAFTPEASFGKNDGFSGYGTNISKYDMWIFDRWGNMIFHTDDLEKKWDGRANFGVDVAQQDVYIYLVNLLDFEGNPYKYTGTVTLIK